MSSSKISALTAATAASTDDLLVIVDDPGGTPASKKITVDNFQGSLSKVGKVTVTQPATSATLTLTDGTTVTGPAASGTIATLAGSETLSNKTLTAPKFADGGFIADASGNEQLVFDSNASAVNYVEIANAATGNAVHIHARGDDANVGIHIGPKAAGYVNIEDGTDDTKRLRFDVSGATTGKIATLTSSHTVDRTITLPDATTTLVGTDTTNTLTNKTIAGAAISGALTGTGAYVPVSLLNSGASASASTFWRGDGTWATPASGLSWGASASGTTADGLSLTLSNTADLNAKAFAITVGSTQSNANDVGAMMIDIGSSGFAYGLTIKGAGDNASSELDKHLVLWANTANNNNHVLSFGNGTSYSQRGGLRASGGMFLYDSRTSGTTLDITTPSSSGASAIGVSIVASNTQTNAMATQVIGMGSSGNVMGLIIKGTGSTTVGDTGTGKNHLSLWGNTNSNANKVLSVANGTSYTENVWIAADGRAFFNHNNSTFPAYSFNGNQSGGALTGPLFRIGSDNNASYSNGFLEIDADSGSGTDRNTQKTGIKVSMWASSSTLTATTTAGEGGISASYRKDLTGASTITDTAGHGLYVLRTNVSNHASANYTVSSATLQVEQVATQTSGTLAVTGAVARLVAPSSASFTGRILSTVNGSTEHFYVTTAGLPGWITGDTQSTVGAAGGASALPATPTGYAKIDVNGTTKVVPYYDAS